MRRRGSGGICGAYQDFLSSNQCFFPIQLGHAQCGSLSLILGCQTHSRTALVLVERSEGRETIRVFAFGEAVRIVCYAELVDGGLGAGRLLGVHKHVDVGPIATQGALTTFAFDGSTCIGVPSQWTREAVGASSLWGVPTGATSVANHRGWSPKTCIRTEGTRFALHCRHAGWLLPPNVHTVLRVWTLESVSWRDTTALAVAKGRRAHLRCGIVRRTGLTRACAALILIMIQRAGTHIAILARVTHREDVLGVLARRTTQRGEV